MKNNSRNAEYNPEKIQGSAIYIRHLITGVCLAALVLNGETACNAEDLTVALRAAYERSEVIANAAAEYDADLERVTISRAAGLPELNASVGVNEAVAGPRIGPDLVTVQGEVSVPLYRGGSVKNQVKAAKAQSEATSVGRRTAEAQVFSEVVSAYANIIRDRQILALSRDNLATLTTTLNATRSRFLARDLTRTDVAQAESRVALAVGEVETAEANLIEAAEEFRRVTGMQAAALSPLPDLRNLPVDPETAAAVALEENPQVLAARAVAEARRYEWRAAKGSALPSVSAVANGRYGNSAQIPLQGDNGRFGATVGFSVNVPLFQGGRTSAGIRESSIRESQAMLAISDLERTLAARARSEYANWRATTAVVGASQSAVSAARSALAGVRAESDVGSRTILDILNAEQELRNAQVQLVSAQRDSYVAAFALLTTMGRTQAQYLGVGDDTAPLVAEPVASPAEDPPAAPVVDKPAAPQTWAKLEVEELPIEVAVTAPQVAQAAQSQPLIVQEGQKPALVASPPSDREHSAFQPTQWVIQLAAYSKEAAARNHWKSVEAETTRIVGSTRPVIATFRSGANEMFRLAIGPFEDFASAEAACHDLRLQKQNCIVRRFSTLGQLRWTGTESRDEGAR